MQWFLWICSFIHPRRVNVLPLAQNGLHSRRLLLSFHAHTYCSHSRGTTLSPDVSLSRLADEEKQQSMPCRLPPKTCLQPYLVRRVDRQAAQLHFPSLGITRAEQRSASEICADCFQKSLA